MKYYVMQAIFGCKKLKSSNILGEMFQIFVCLFTYLVILDENFNVIIFFGLLNETNLLLNEFDFLLILYGYQFVPRKQKFFF